MPPRRILGNRRFERMRLWGLLPVVAAAGLGLRLVSHPMAPTHQTTWKDLLRFPPQRLSKLSISELNLLCASGLSADNEPDVKECLAAIDVWAQRVRSETQRHQYRYEKNPAEFENSPGFFRMLMLTVVLTEDYGVHYDPRRMAGPECTRMDDGFFAEPRSVFLHGVLGPDRVGACSSLPVLYVAVGRQLGYPLKLVTTKGHLFVRWEGAGERFNVEVTGHGLNRFSDEYYRHWPFEITAAEEESEGYLRSLAPAGELAVFLSVRGMCLREKGRLAEAAESFAAAARLAPGCGSYQTMVSSLEAALGRQAMRRTKGVTEQGGHNSTSHL